jgi:Domain of unknown function (DUF4340)
MTPRRLAILFIAGFLVIALSVWLSSKRHLERATSAGDLVLPGLEKGLNSVTQVKLAKGDGTKTTLEKGATDWMVVERGYPADSGKVRKFLLDLAALNVVEEKTHTPANYPQLGVEDVNSPKATGTRVDTVTPAKTYSIIVGKSSSAKSGYVRVANAEQSLLAAPSLSVDSDPRRWLDHTFLDIPQDKVKEFTVKPADGPPYSASRPSKEQTDFAVTGIPKGREISNPTAADPIAGSLSSLTLDDVQHPPATVDPKSVSHATFRTFDGLSLDVAGRKDGTRTLVSVAATSTDKASEAQAATLNAQTKGWEYEIPAYKYDAIFRPLEDLLKKLPDKKADGKKPAARKTAAKTPAAP